MPNSLLTYNCGYTVGTAAATAADSSTAVRVVYVRTGTYIPGMICLYCTWSDGKVHAGSACRPAVGGVIPGTWYQVSSNMHPREGGKTLLSSRHLNAFVPGNLKEWSLCSAR